MTQAEVAAEAFLGVEHSLTGRRWQQSAADSRLALSISQRHALPEMVGRVLAARGIGLEQAPSFLNPTLRDLLPDPLGLKDMDKAAGRLADAIAGGQTIGVFGDYDVDGATSAALLLRYFSALGASVAVHIPDRMTEGYGPNAPALRALAALGAIKVDRVVCAVDCGIAAFEALAAAAEAGLDVIVVDHHEAEAGLPKALAVVNPNRLDESREQGHLAAVGVAFLLVVAVQGVLLTSTTASFMVPPPAVASAQFALTTLGLPAVTLTIAPLASRIGNLCDSICRSPPGATAVCSQA